MNLLQKTHSFVTFESPTVRAVQKKKTLKSETCIFETVNIAESSGNSRVHKSGHKDFQNIFLPK